MDKKLTQVSRAARPAGSPFMDHTAVGKPQAKLPAIKSIPNLCKVHQEKSGLEIEWLQQLRDCQMSPTPNGQVRLFLKARDGVALSQGQAIFAGFRMVQRGHPGHGVILHYAQRHHVEIPGLLASVNAPYRMAPKLKSEIIQCQRKIFDELLTSGIKHIFLEGLEETLMPDNLDAGDEKASDRDKIRWLLRDYRPGQTLAPELESLFYAGGALLYGYLVAGVTLHRTTTSTQIDKQDAYFNSEFSRARLIANNFTVPQEDRTIFFAEVEQIAMAEIKRVMQGKSLNVALIFGRDHSVESFTGHCGGADFSPFLYSKDITT